MITENVTRRCSRCKTDKPLASFWRDPSKYLGRSYACAECRRTVARSRYSAVKQQQRRLREGVKHEARVKVTNAIASGRLVKSPCFLCGEVKVDAHHLNYDYPLSVVWLCRTHHSGVHRGII